MESTRILCFSKDSEVGYKLFYPPVTTKRLQRLSKVILLSPEQAEMEGVRLALKSRGKTCGRPCQFGYDAQFAYFLYLNLFCEHANFVFVYDDLFGSRFCLPYDFRIRFPDPTSREQGKGRGRRLQGYASLSFSKP
jgi:hypothetical protein